MPTTSSSPSSQAALNGDNSEQLNSFAFSRGLWGAASPARAPSFSSSDAALYPSSLDAAATKFADSEAYRTGGIAWGSAASSSNVSRRPSHALTEPESKPLNRPLTDFPRRASVNGPPAPAPFLSSLLPLTPSNGAPVGGPSFPGPSISIMDQFGTLADATRQAELAHRMDKIKQDAASPNGSASGVPHRFQNPGNAQTPSSISAGVFHSSTPGSPSPSWAAPHRVPSSSSLTGLSPPSRTPQGPGGSPKRSPRMPSHPVHLAPQFIPHSAGGPMVGGPLPQGPHGPAGGIIPNVPAGPSSSGGPVPSGPSGSAGSASAVSGGSGGSAGSASSHLDGKKQRQTTRKKDWRRGKRYDSAILEDLRTHSKPMDISSILGHVAEVSGDQHGSRFIQEHLPNASVEVRAMFFAEALKDVVPLMTDVFGNYVIQLLFELGTPEQRASIVNEMLTRVLGFSLQMYGCRVVQMAIRYSSEDLQMAIVDELRDNVVRCVKDHNGNHVIQKSIECIDPRHVQFIYEAMMARTIELAKHTYGCRVVQRILEYADEATKRKLLAELRQHVDTLTEDRYGNYVIQHIVDHGPTKERDWIFERLVPNVIQLSTHKYASNVVEKAFIMGTPQQRTQMIDTILKTEDKGTPAIVVMIKDQYANYVVQKVLDSAKGEDYARLITAIRPHLAGLKRSSYGKHLASIERLLQELTLPQS